MVLKSHYFPENLLIRIDNAIKASDEYNDRSAFLRAGAIKLCKAIEAEAEKEQKKANN